MSEKISLDSSELKSLNHEKICIFIRHTMPIRIV